MTKEKKLNLSLLVVVLLTIVGSGLLIAGFIVPPLGMIDSSVLVAFGETSTFVAAVLGVDYNYKYKEYKMSMAKNLSENE